MAYSVFVVCGMFHASLVDYPLVIIQYSFAFLG